METMNIAEVKYTSPSGKEFSFAYENVSKETDLKTATFTFPEKDGAYIQALGRGGRRFPMTCIFTGELCTENADKFEAALEERGIGSLKHPLYGVRSVVPTGTIKRTDGLVTDVYTATVEIVFSETITNEELLKSAPELASKINEKVEVFSDSAIDEIVGTIELSNTSEVLKAQENYSKAVKVITDNMENISVASGKDKMSLNEAVNGAYAAIRKVIAQSTKFTSNIRGYAASVLKILRLPATVVCAPAQILTAYANMTKDIMKKFKNDPFGVNKVKNQYAIAKFALSGAIAATCETLGVSCTQSSSSGGGSGSSENSNDGGFKTREDAIAAAEEIQDIFEKYKEFCDTKIALNADVESDQSYEALLEVVQTSVSLILETAFSLKKRRIIKLDRDRQVIELLAELYGEVDSHYDEFVSDNNLNWETIQVIPMGIEVAYYV